MSNIMGLVGEAGVGKDTVFSKLDFARGAGCPPLYNFKFADPLHNMVSALTHGKSLTYEDKDRVQCMDLEAFEFRRWLISLAESRLVDSTMLDLYNEITDFVMSRKEVQVSNHSQGYGLFYATPRKVMQLLGTEFFRKRYGDDIWVKAMQHRIEELRTRDPDAGIVITDVRFANEVQVVDKVVGVFRKDKPRFYYTEDHVSTLLGQSVSIAGTAKDQWGLDVFCEQLNGFVQSCDAELHSIIMTYTDDDGEVFIREVWS